MRLLLFESKKILRLPGIRFLLIGVLMLNLMFCIFYSIPSPTQTEQEYYIIGYEESIRYVIRLAELNATEYEASVGADNFNVRYQQDVAKRYSKLWMQVAVLSICVVRLFYFEIAAGKLKFHKASFSKDGYFFCINQLVLANPMINESEMLI